MAITTVTRILGSLLLLAAVEGSAVAGTIAVFGDHGARHDLATELTAQGHTVTGDARLPANLDAYDAIWHIGAIQPIGDEDRKRLLDFVGTGGGLYLTGEAIGADDMNASVTTLIHQLVIGRGVKLATAPDGPSGLHAFNATAPAELTSVPHKLETWRPGMAGMIDGVSDRNVVARGPDGATSGAAWRHTELVAGGQLIVMMDAGWLRIDGNRAAIAANFARFLESQPLPSWERPDPEVIGVKPGHRAAGEPAGDDGEPDDDGADDGVAVGGGCSAGGGAGGGSVLGLLAVSLLARRRRRA